MSNLFRWGILPAFLMTFSGMSQDIAAPSMANVDLEMEDEKKIAAYREAMARHLQLGIIWMCIVELEEKDNRAVLVATLWIPVLQISGNSMTPTLYLRMQEAVAGEIVLFIIYRKRDIENAPACIMTWQMECVGPVAVMYLTGSENRLYGRILLRRSGIGRQTSQHMRRCKRTTVWHDIMPHGRH